MKFLIMGCNGMAGHMISLYLKEQGHQVIGFARKKSRFVETIIGDAQDQNLIRNVTADQNYDVILNCIGVLNQDAEEHKPEAVYINSLFPHLLAEFTRGSKTKVIQMSTDCVFSGNEGGGYLEHDITDGNTFYGRTKRLGEIEGENSVTIRCSIVGPDLNADGMGLLNWFMHQNEPVNGFTEVFWSGQTTLQYAKTIEFVAKSDITGIYHCVPDGSISKYELLDLFNKYLRNNKVKIRPVNEPKSDRSLKCARSGIDYFVPGYEEMICDLSVWMRKHKELYPHYQME